MCCPLDTCAAALKLLSWNIERGMKLKEIIEILKQEDADVSKAFECEHAQHARDCAQFSCFVLCKVCVPTVRV